MPPPGPGAPGRRTRLGLDAEAQTIEYRAGNSKEFALAKLPGLKRFAKVTSTDLKSTPDDVAIETIEIAYEALIIVSAQMAWADGGRTG